MKEWLQNQHRNRFLWVPLVMAFGGAGYFMSPSEPSVPFAWIFALVAFGVACIGRVPTWLRGIAIAMFGFLYAAAYTDFIATPVMSRANLRDTHIVARVTNLDYTPDKARIYLKLPASDIGAGDGTATVRVSVSRDGAVPDVGDTIRATVGLYRPGGADAPGAFDYARWAYFNGLSATGYMDDFEILSHCAGMVSAWRNAAHVKLNSFLADALVLGYKNTLDADSRAIWMATGVGHVWSISGFHITLVATWLIAVFMLIFRSIPYITRRIPARIPATIAAWVGLVIYLMLAGASVATVRAFLMASLVFIALLLGRSAASLRNAAIAFCAVFLINPHFVVQAGFQLSFAAIFGLVWFWDKYRWLPRGRVLRVIYAAVMTATIATVFTMPFVAMHFGAVPLYGVIGNLILLPIFSLVIMPMTVIGTIAGLCGWMLPMDAATWMYEVAFAIAKVFAQLPYATIHVPYIGAHAISTIVVGFACLMFIRVTRGWVNYAVAGALVFAGVVMIATTPRPVFYSTTDNELVAFRGADGKLEFNKASASNHYFTFDTWRAMNGEDATAPRERRKSTKGVIDFKTPNFSLVYIQKFVPLMENIVGLCGVGGPDYIVSYFRVDAPNCRARILNGGFVIYDNGRVRFMNQKRRWHRNRSQ